MPESVVRRFGSLAAIAVLAACAGVPERYAGTLIRTSGTCESTSANLTRRGKAVSFAPNDSVLVLQGAATQGGEVHATLVTPGLNNKPYTMTLTGIMTSETFTGRYSTPVCRADVSLQVQ